MTFSIYLKIMETIKQKFIVTTEEAGQRLDKFLLSKFSSFSRSKIQKLIEKSVTVKPFDSAMLRSGNNAHRLKTGDIVVIKFAGAKPFRLEPNPDLVVPVIFENNDYLIINKPAGMVVHPGEGHLKQDTLANWLVARYPEIRNIGPAFAPPSPKATDGRSKAAVGKPNPLRPGIVHRLDKETSGVMVVAKINEFYEFIREQFDKRKVKKTYLAWVKGEVKLGMGRISKPIKRGKGFKWVVMEQKPSTRSARSGSNVFFPKRSEVEVRVGSKDRVAITNYKVLKRETKKTLLEIKPLTGRMHQIRVHLSSIGHPVLGDTIYGKDNKGPLLLHAWRIQFMDLDGDTKEYEAARPQYF